MYICLHACRVHAYVMPYFGLAVDIFIVFTVVSWKHWTTTIVLVGWIFLCLCVSAYVHAHMCACLNCDAFFRCSSINFLTFYS